MCMCLVILKCVKQKPLELREEKDKSTILVTTLILISVIDKTGRQISNDIEDQKPAIN